MILCICHRVSDRDVARAVRNGCDSFDTLQDELRVATACGACESCARETFEACHPGACAGHCGQAHAHPHPSPADRGGWAAAAA